MSQEAKKKAALEAAKLKAEQEAILKAEKEAAEAAKKLGKKPQITLNLNNYAAPNRIVKIGVKMYDGERKRFTIEELSSYSLFRKLHSSSKKMLTNKGLHASITTAEILQDQDGYFEKYEK